MDYFREIADHPDITEAVPLVVMDPSQADLRLAFTRPGMWRAELVNWFHLQPSFAAAVWRTLGRCRTERTRLIRAARSTSWIQTGRVNSALKPFGLGVNSSEAQFERILLAATEQQFEDLRRALQLRYLGPAFIENLVDDAKLTRSTDTIAELIADVSRVREL